MKTYISLLKDHYPTQDKDISFTYGTKTFDSKKKNKEEFLKTEKKSKECFTILIATEHISDSEEQTTVSLLEAISHIKNITPIILGKEQSNFKNYPCFSHEKIGYALAIADSILFFPSQLEESLSLLILALRFGTVPILSYSKKTNGIIREFNPLEEKGNALLYEKDDLWNIFASIIKAKENYKFPYDWENLVKSCMLS